MKKIQFDGAAIPNPGEMAIGVVLIENDNIITKISKKLPNNGTNNIAEYTALLTGIFKALELGWKKVSIEGDSKLVVNQINGTWRINKAHLESLYTCISALLVTMFEPHLNTCNKNTKTQILQGNFVIKISCFFYLKKLIMSIMQNSFIEPVPIAIGFTTHK